MKKEKAYNEAINGDEGFEPGDGYPSCDGEPCANVSDEPQEMCIRDRTYAEQLAKIKSERQEILKKAALWAAYPLHAYYTAPNASKERAYSADLSLGKTCLLYTSSIFSLSVRLR